VGVDGFTERAGFTGNDTLRVEAVRDMAKQAKQIVVLTESGKFGKQGVVPLLPNDRIATVITDTGVPAAMETFLSAHDVGVIKVEKD
jgi:DeoR/GlpR family transcriptional regulator of sugar metabolism